MPGAGGFAGRTRHSSRNTSVFLSRFGSSTLTDSKISDEIFSSFGSDDPQDFGDYD